MCRPMDGCTDGGWVAGAAVDCGHNAHFLMDVQMGGGGVSVGGGVGRCVDR